MSSNGSKSTALSLLYLNLLLYIVVASISGWAINYGIEETADETSDLLESAKILFPIYFPIGNLATGFFVIFTLIAAVVGITTCLSGIQNLTDGSISNLTSAAASSIMAWSLIFVAMGLAYKEISIGPRTGSLRTLETLTIILNGTQIACAGAINKHLWSTATTNPHGGRV